MLLKSKQIDLDDLAVALATVINNNVTYKAAWASILNNTFLTAIFSDAAGNLVDGQTNLVIAYATTPLSVFVYRNGAKLIEDEDYTVSTGAGNFTVTLLEAADNSVGAVFGEVIEVNYY